MSELLSRNFQRILVFIVVLFVGYVSYYYFTRLPFDSAQWKASGNYENLSVRNRMCSDLLRNDRLIGLNHTQVIVLLGKPDQYHLDYWTMGYMVGYDMIDPVYVGLTAFFHPHWADTEAIDIRQKYENGPA
ncbi:hypothetical protein EON83_04500 [bacterium]|nr:MAG: hypothetical protein EON83_04500 [bacterium]